MARGVRRPPSPTLCALLGLGEPDHRAPRSGVLCRLTGSAPRLPLSATWGVPSIIEEGTPEGQEPSRHTPVRVCGTASSRTPSTAAARPCGRVDLLRRLFVSASKARAPSSPPPEDPPRQGLGSRQTPTSSGSPAPKSGRPSARDALSRSVQPTSCHEYPANLQLPSWPLSRPRPAARSDLRSRARLHAVVGLSSPLAPQNLCRHLRPRVAWRCASPHQLQPPSPPFRVDPSGR